MTAPTVDRSSARRTDEGAPRSAAGGARAALDVLFLSVSGQLGGAERALLDMVAALRARESAARIGVLVAADGPLAGELERLGAEVTRLPLPGRAARLGDSAARGRRLTALARVLAAMAVAAPAALAYALRLRRALARLRPAVVHSNGFKMHVLSALAAPRHAAVVWHLHDFTATRPLMARLLRALARRCTLAVANSRAVAEDGRRVLGERVPVRAVHNAVDLACFAPDGPRADLDALAGLAPAAPGTVRIGLVATLASWKGHDVFLRALARVPRALPWRAYVVSGAVYQTVGSQQSLDALRRTAESLGLADRVGFTGFVADSAGVMRALDVVVHASTQPEPFGLVIAEAMAAGRAVVLSAAGGAAELATPEREALAHPPGDVAALGDAITRLVGDRALRERLGAAARAGAAARFDRARLGAEIAAAHAAARAAAAAGPSRG